jgi:LmbE family N-acetylglucosaminyl deacetylase
MNWVYLSPHFDDAVLSCGGMIWEQVKAGDTVEIWTICAGAAPSEADLPAFAVWQHAEWKAGSRLIPQRRAEDRAACERVGAIPHYWNLPDCIYRRLPTGEDLIRSAYDLWMPVHPAELVIVEELRGWLRRSLPRDATLVSPLSLGNHVDHRIVRAAAEQVRRPLYYYADYPYVDQKELWQPVGMPEEALKRVAVSAEGVAAWREGVAAYASQINGLFVSAEGMTEQLNEFWKKGGGSWLWRVD